MVARGQDPPGNGAGKDLSMGSEFNAEESAHALRASQNPEALDALEFRIPFKSPDPPRPFLSKALGAVKAFLDTSQFD